MKNLLFIAFLCPLWLYSAKIHALGLREVSLSEMSHSGQTMVIDQGLLENFADGTYGKFYLQAGTLDQPKIFLVAEGKMIKTFPKKSFWYMSKIYLPNLVQAGSRLLILTSNDVTRGRSMKAHQQHVLISNDDYKSIDDFLTKNENNVPDRLLQDTENFESSSEIYSTDKLPASDLEIKTFEGLKNKKVRSYSEEFKEEVEDRYFVGNQELKIADIKNKEDLKLLDSLSRGYLDKSRKQQFGLTNGLYKDQKKTQGQNELNDKMAIVSVYDEVKENKKTEEIIDPKALAKIKRDGQSWSEDMDDSTLRRYFNSTGLAHEMSRRELALNELDGNEIMFHYSGSISDHSTSLDQNYRRLGYTLGLGYDLHLSRTSNKLKDWSLQFFLERSTADYDLGGINARGQEGTYGGYINYYFINNPLTLNSLIVLGGIGMKVSTIDMSATSLSKDYSYQALCLPALQVLTKYRFRAGDLTEDTVNVGASFNFGVSLDMKSMSVNETLSDNIDGKISITDIKYLLGMSVYF